MLPASCGCLYWSPAACLSLTSGHACLWLPNHMASMVKGENIILQTFLTDGGILKLPFFMDNDQSQKHKIGLLLKMYECLRIILGKLLCFVLCPFMHSAAIFIILYSSGFSCTQPLLWNNANTYIKTDGQVTHSNHIFTKYGKMMEFWLSTTRSNLEVST